MIVLITIMLMASCASQKTDYKIPEPKLAVLSEDNPYKETIQFPFDDKGLDMNVTMSFDEPSNILTLTITGSRQLMVFRQDVFYGIVFSHPLFKDRVFHPEKLPYPVLVQPNMSITMAKSVWKGFNKRRIEHLFNNWLVGVSPELQAITPSIRTNDSPEATLIVDSIVQRFRVDPKATKASFTLRNFLVADKDGLPVPNAMLKRKSTSSLNYKIVYEKDLNLTFNVKIQRNPCFALDSLIAATEARINEIRKAYTNLHAACPTGIVNSKQEQGIFNQHKKYLLSQFTCITDSSACSTLQDAYNRYNCYVDSINTSPCTFVKPLSDIEKEEGNGFSHTGIKPSTILDAAHRLDNIVSQIMISNDAAQIRDLTMAGHKLILTITNAVRAKGLINEEQRKAYILFLKAKSYFKSAIL